MLKDIDFDLLQLSPHRPLKSIPKVAIEDIRRARETGFVPPVTARPINDSSTPQRYEILLGEYAWLIAQQAGFPQVPTYILDHTNDEEAEQILHFGQLGKDNPMARAEYLAQFQQKSARTITALAAQFGMSRTELSHLLRLNQLHPKVKNYVRVGYLTVGHARQLVTLDFSAQLDLANQILNEGLSVRAVENFARDLRAGKPRSTTKTDMPKSTKTDPNIVDLETRLTDALGCQVVLRDNKLTIDYYGNNEILEGILDNLLPDET